MRHNAHCRRNCTEGLAPFVKTQIEIYRLISVGRGGGTFSVTSELHKTLVISLFGKTVSNLSGFI